MGKRTAQFSAMWKVEETWSKQQIFVSLCVFGNHHVDPQGFRRTLGTALLYAPRDLNGREWIAGRAALLVKDRVAEIRAARPNDYYKNSIARMNFEAELDNFVLRLQHLNQTRI